MIHFYDSASPDNIPSGVYAAVYINGYAWDVEDLRRMRRVFRVSVLPEAYWARWARCLDVENGAATPQELPAFVRHRWACGFNDATGYVNRSNWLACFEACRQAQVTEPYWWVSTLDGTMDVELKNEAGDVLARAWAVQYGGGMHNAYDLSVLHGANNFVKP